MNSNTQSEQKIIQGYDFASFLQQVQDAILDGYSLQMKTMQGYPFHSNGFYTVAVVKHAEPAKVVVQETVKPSVAENKEQEQAPVAEKPQEPEKKPRKAKAE